MNSIKVSIITVCYNSAQTIEDTICSVNSQTYTNIEHIIIDGGSSDETNAIISKHKDSVSVHISQKDDGLYDAMNKGLHIATGDIVGILNSDDVFAGDKVISTIANVFYEHPETDVTYSDVAFYDHSLKKKVRHYSSNGFDRSKLKYGIMPAHPSLYIRNTLANKIGSYSLSYKIASDFDYVVRLFSTEHIRTHYIALELVKMRLGGISTSGIKSNILLNREILQSLKLHNISSSVFHLLVKYPKKLLGYVLKYNMRDDQI